jgi:hypothetical protein
MLALALSVLAAPASADTFVTSIPGDGNQNFAGDLGDSFTVGDTDLTLTHAGVFDDDQDGLNAAIEWSLWQGGTVGGTGWTLVASQTFDPGEGTLDGNHVFLDIPDVTLVANTVYVVVASGYGLGDENYNESIFPKDAVCHNMACLTAGVGYYATPPANGPNNATGWGPFSNGDNFGVASFRYTPCPSAPENLIANGSFQEPDLPPGGTGQVDVVQGWTMGPRADGQGVMVVVDRDYARCADGDQVLALLGHVGTWSVEQAVSVTAGDEHMLSFLYGKGGDWFRTTFISCTVYHASNLSTPIATSGFLLAPQTSSPETSPMLPFSITFTPSESDIVVRFADTASSRTFALLDKVVLINPAPPVPPNTAPTANAGLDVAITTLEQATTTISGTAGDADAEDTLTCLWRDGMTVLLGPITLTGTSCDLELGTLGAFAPGVHTLTLEICDGTECRTDTMVLTVENPPVANAGMDASTHPGDTVNLSGGGSMDDQTAAFDLDYAWSFVSVPGGSTATLTGANTATPSFVSDLLGDYTVRLVVTDGDGHESLPDEVLISSNNVPPTANAGIDQVVQIGNLAVLDGSGSSDPDSDDLTYAWSITSAPGGSTATLVVSGPTDTSPTLTPDLEGTYTITLIVNDGFVNSTADTVDVCGIGPVFAQTQLGEACDYASGLPNGSFDAKGHRKSMCNDYAKIAKFIQKGQIGQAVSHLSAAIQRVDGWTLRGAADPKGAGQPHAADYLLAQVEQTLVYGLLTAALGAIQ